MTLLNWLEDFLLQFKDVEIPVSDNPYYIGYNTGYVDGQKDLIKKLQYAIDQEKKLGSIKVTLIVAENGKYYQGAGRWVKSIYAAKMYGSIPTAKVCWNIHTSAYDDNSQWKDTTKVEFKEYTLTEVMNEKT